MIDWLAFTARRPLYNTYSGYWLYTHVLLNRGDKRFEKVRRLRTGAHRFLLTGYPRSGNTYLTNMVQKVLEVDDFGHHLHTRLGLKLAVREGIRAYVVFRSPLESVMSLILLNSNRNGKFVRFHWLDSAHLLQNSLLLLYIREYIHYHEYALSRPDRINLIPSKVAFSQTQDVLARIACENDLDASRVTKERCSWAENAFLERKHRKQKDTLTAGAPNAEKEAAKAKLREKVESHPLMHRANETFERMEERSTIPEK